MRKITGSSPRSACTSRPPASAGVAGVATTSPGVAANQDSTLFVCCAANRPTPEEPRMTSGTLAPNM